ncbi:protein O-mannosyl-transferase TMTC4-like [Penaeus chinensis]|uniref:protein O-mannosyl-transferase TMTC4-like n=1 Tax=Penaeus chinensis TaxID=139456 RepID=UPI001FB7AC39|nr:protein O-mannosyl-transferase TMTC4-like [Penaeus chinensis]XP_047494242.1 protein O-mannosyl-transferase TMTC4-like [Penaeus chinensis]XP_047494251.1 protein O-mannosyl-transferase TMTC4-like [Penaeus chinensis]
MVCGGMCRAWDGDHHKVREKNGTDKGAGVMKSLQVSSPSSWDEDVPAPELPYPAAALLVGICACVCFVNSLSGDFVFDDSEAIVNNSDLRGDTPLANLFHNDFWGTRLTHPSSHKSYRPLTVLSFRLNYSWGALDPFSYHAVNVVVHCLVSIMSLRVFYVVFGNGAPRAAILSAILFATHPIHTEAVSGIVGRADLLCALFVFVSLLSYVRAVKEMSGAMSYRSRHTVLYLLMTAASTATAMLCKEVGITALGVCSAYDVLLAHGGIIGRTIISVIVGHNLRALAFWRNLPAGILRGLMWRHILLAVTGIALLAARWVVMGSTVPRFMKVDNPASFLDSVVFRSLNYQYTYSLNALLLVLPIWLCFDWSMGCVPVIVNFSDPRLLALPILWFSFVMLLRRGMAQGRASQTSRCVLMGLALGVVPFLPASNLFFRVGFVIAERVLYLPAAGFCILVVTGMRELSAAGHVSKRVLQVGYVLLVVVFVLRCQQRSRDWLTEKQLFSSGLDVCPLNAKVHYNMGKVAADNGDVFEAVSRYREALRLNPDYDQAMNNLANILKDQGHLDEALHLLQQATTLRPDFAAAWMNLGIVQASLGDHSSAETSYLTALTHRSVYPDCLYNLGNLYLEKGDHSAALATWTNATSLKPSLAVAWTNMLILLDSQGLYQSAIDVADKALRHLPSEPALHFNLANTLGKLSRYEESESHFLLATNLDPGNANYWANLGVLYHRWRKYEQAEKSYLHALKLNPTLKSAQDNLNMLLKATGKIYR